MNQNDPILTADDFIRAGACADGVYRVITRLSGKVAAAMPVSAILPLLTRGERLYALRAAEMDGHGDGDGDGTRYPFGYGYGTGYGEVQPGSLNKGCCGGYGFGSRYGYGCADGSGYGDGSGLGYGACYVSDDQGGDSDGEGPGPGYCDGTGDGDGVDGNGVRFDGCCGDGGYKPEETD